MIGGHLNYMTADDDCVTVRGYYLNDKDPFSTASSSLEPAVGKQLHLSIDNALVEQLPSILNVLKAPHKIGDVALQIVTCRPGTPADYGNYLDLDVSLAEQPDELATLREKGSNNIVVRTHLSRRVHAIIEKLLNSTGRDLRRILFSLKQILQDDKDLVHEFVQNDGLACLIKVGCEADQNYQNYILRALGQVMLYVDGMNGVIAHNETIQWLYSLLGSQYRLVVKTALKLLVVFVEYTECNSLLLLAAVYTVDRKRNAPPWNYLMTLLNEDCGDSELLTYAVTLLNKTLNGVPDQDTYYDIVDAVEEQGMEEAIKNLTNMHCSELTEQCRLYELVLAKEDSEESTGANEPYVHKRLPSRSRLSSEERRSQRLRIGSNSRRPEPLNKSSTMNLTASFEKQTNSAPSKGYAPNGGGFERQSLSIAERRESARPLIKPWLSRTEEKEEKEETEAQLLNTAQTAIGNGLAQKRVENLLAPPPKMPDFSTVVVEEQQPVAGGQSKRIGAVHSLAVKYQQQQQDSCETPPASKVVADIEKEDDAGAPGGDGSFASVLSRAKKGMDKKLALRDGVDNRSESQIQWEKAMQTLSRPLIVNDLDFTELNDNDDKDPLCAARLANDVGALAASAAMSFGGMAPPPPPPGGFPAPPGGLVLGGGPPPPPPPASSFSSGSTLNGGKSLTANAEANRCPSPSLQSAKDAKTVRLFWKEANCQMIPGVLDNRGIFWQKVRPVQIDTEKLGSLFVTRTKEIATKKKEEKKAEVSVLDAKRSNAINIGLTKLPPPRAIKTAILKFDSSIMNKDCIEKLLSTMLPTLDEREAIMAAQADNPDLPLGTAEQFLLMLSEIPQLRSRLRLWLFMLDYANMEREVAEPLMDLKLAMEELDKSGTFQQVMATLLSIGNFLNGAEVKGFQIDYLAKVPEVKDTVYKHSLVYHLASIMLEKFPDSTDLYSEMGAVARSAKVDFDEVKTNLDRMELECKASWDHLRLVAKHESHGLKEKISQFLSDCAQRIITLKVIHKRIINRFRKFLLYMGMPQHAIKDTKINAICKTISEFALEYRTSREKILQQKRRQMDKRERNKTRGKLITDGRSWSRTLETTTAGGKSKEHDELRKILKTNGGVDRPSNGGWNFSLPGGTARHKRQQQQQQQQAGTSGSSIEIRSAAPVETTESPDDEILDGLVKAATATTMDHPKERRRARQFNRKSLRRTRTLKLADDQTAGNF